MKTTKKILSILLIFALAGAVSSCKLSFKEPTELEKCLSAYKSFLTEYIVDKDKDRFASFTLIYIDDNDIPELSVSADYSHDSRAELFIFDGKEVKKAGDYGSNGKLGYIERTGTFVDSVTNSDVTDETVYKLENGEVTKVCSYSLTPTDPEDLDAILERHYYYIDGEKVSAEEYEASYSQNVPSEPKLASTPFTSGSYDLSEKGIKMCFEQSKK